MDYGAARDRTVDALDVELAATEAAFRAVPRHRFVPEAWRDLVYADRPLPIGEGATISAPSVVAAMVDHLAVSPGDRVLEIGTGSGYHAAVVAEVVGPENVFSVEYDPELAKTARERLADLGYGEVSIQVGDGREGWPEHAPYDAAYATCAAREFPPAVVEQVREGGCCCSRSGSWTPASCSRSDGSQAAWTASTAGPSSSFRCGALRPIPADLESDPAAANPARATDGLPEMKLFLITLLGRVTASETVKGLPAKGR